MGEFSPDDVVGDSEGKFSNTWSDAKIELLFKYTFFGKNLLIISGVLRRRLETNFPAPSFVPLISALI